MVSRPATWGGGTPAFGCTSGSYNPLRWECSRIRHAAAHSIGRSCSGRIAGTLPWPLAACQEQLATLSHAMLSCPVFQAVWQWFGDVWTAVTQQPAPPLHADLLLADDRRGPWQPAAGLDSLWQRLRLMVITQLWDAYCRARSHGQSSQRRQRTSQRESSQQPGAR